MERTETSKLNPKSRKETTTKALSEVNKLVEVLAKDQKEARQYSLRSLFRAATKLAVESPGTLNLKIAATVLKELRYSFKMFYPNRFTPKITMFGSARTGPNHPAYKLAKAFAIEATRRDFMIITGGGPGVMAAGNEGAKRGGFGLNIRLPHEQEANPFIKVKENLIHYKYFFTRKLFLVKEAAAFALFPGGFGTMDETFEVLTLVQTGKSNLIPVVLMEPKGSTYWEGLIKFINKELLKAKLISPADLTLFKVFQDSGEAVDHISHFYKNYHSCRMVKNTMVIRMKRGISEKTLAEVNKKFKHLSLKKPFSLGRALPEENNEPETLEMPRLIFPFGRSDFSGIRSLVDFINQNSL